jgi:nicotinate-nucleotide pyrophosphorylase (carboxylating)
LESTLENVLRSFLAEDIGYGDITTDALVKHGTQATGYVICKETGVIAGIREAKALLQIVGCETIRSVQDGTMVKPGTRILYAKGPAHSLLKVERVLLNLISHMSGVATATHELVQIAEKSGGQGRIACTRKTLPGLRYFEKRAVELGGGDTHRLRLDDMVLIKDNHLAIAGTIEKAVKLARSKTSFTKKIEVEVTTLDQALEAAKAGADIILLDNMQPDKILETVKSLKTKQLRDRVILEASGGIAKENIASYLKTGIDIVSVGKITNSARAIDMSLELQPAAKTKVSRR